MDASFFGPLSAPHRTKRFWISVALGLVPILAPTVFHRAMGLPLFSLRAYVISGAETLGLWAVAMWCIFRFGRIALLAIAAALILFACWARSHV